MPKIWSKSAENFSRYQQGKDPIGPAVLGMHVKSPTTRLGPGYIRGKAAGSRHSQVRIARGLNVMWGRRKECFGIVLRERTTPSKSSIH